MSGVPPPGGVPVTRDGILDGVGQLWGSLRGGLMQLHQLTRTVAARGGGGRTTAPRILPTGPPPPDLDLGPLYDAGGWVPVPAAGTWPRACLPGRPVV